MTDTDQRFPLFLTPDELLLTIEALREAERNELRHHSPEKAQAFGALADKLIAEGEKAV